MYTSENLSGAQQLVKEKAGTDLEEMLATLRDRGQHLEKFVVRLRQVNSKLSDEPVPESENKTLANGRPPGHLAQFSNALEGFAMLLGAMDREICKLEKII